MNLKHFVKNHLVKIILGASLSLSLFGGLVFAIVKSTVVDKPKYILSAHDFNNINNDLNGHYIISQQTFISDEPIVPIGTKEQPFTGVIECYNTSKTMSSLCNIYFDTEYIDKSFQDVNSEEVDIGLFAYNSGTIKGIFFWNINMPDLSKYSYTNKRVNFGTIAAHNNGIIERCCVESFKGTLSARNLCCGIIAGVNTGEIKYCSPGSNLSVDCLGESFIGGVCGINKPSIVDAKNHFVFDSLIYATIAGSINIVSSNLSESFSIYFGGICGLMNGGTINNCYSSSQIKNTKLGSSKLIYGSFVGYCNSNVTISSSLSNIVSAYVNFVGNLSPCIGILVNTNLNIRDFLIHSKLNIANQFCRSGFLYSEMVGENKINSSNNFYYDSYIDGNDVLCDNIDEIDFNKINLEALNFNKDLWDKGYDSINFNFKIW